MSEWVIVNLGDIADFTTGKSNVADAQEDGIFPLFDRSQSIKRSNKFLFDREAIIVPGEGQEFIPRYYKGKFDLHQRAYAVFPSQNVDARFIYYSMLHNRSHFALVAVGSTVKSLRLNSFQTFPVSLPSIGTQRAIAHLLGSLDDKIELNRSTNQTLEAMMRALFKDWFVDFGPVRAKMDGRLPSGLSAHIVALFPDALDAEGKPEGWIFDDLHKLASLNSESWSRNNYPEEIEYVDLANTKWGTIEATVHLSKKEAPSRAQRILRIGDTIVGTVRPGNGSYSYISTDGLTGSTGFAVLRPKEPAYRELVYLGATDRDNIERLSHLADGGAYPAVRPDVVLKSPVTFPKHELILTFSEITSPLLSRIEHNKNESRTLSQLRDLLLPKLLSGEIRIKDAEQVIGDAL